MKVQVVAVTAVQAAGVATAGLAVTVYDARAEPPVKDGTDHATWTAPPLMNVQTLSGALGVRLMTMAPEAAEAALVSAAAFVAVTVKVYDAPLVKPVKVQRSVEVTHGAGVVPVV